jgi:hypothetical protein
MPLFKPPTSEAVRSLQQVASFGLGPQPTQPQMLETVQRIEEQYPASNSAELEYWLGITWRNYTAWFVRGDERKQYLEKAVVHLERAYALEKANRDSKWMTYACELGLLLIDEALVRDLERGISLLEPVFQSTQDYEPLLCSYAEALYKMGDYERAASVATELHKRAKNSNEWKRNIPPAPMRIAAMAYRAEVKQLRKDDRDNEALSASNSLLTTGAASENDRKIHEKLKAAVR